MIRTPVPKTIRLLPEISDIIEEMAKADERSFAWTVNHLLKNLLLKDNSSKPRKIPESP